MLSSLSITQLEELTGGKAQGKEFSGLITQISIDSRQIIQPDQCLFVALRGVKADGADFIPTLIQAGLRVFLVHQDRTIDPELAKNATFIPVKNTRNALQAIASFQRSQFIKPVVGITGSNGKTIVKEWLGQVLSQSFTVAKSPKSYNSQVGVPLSIFGIQAYHQVAILEAGVSKLGEMPTLSAMISPNLGIFTNIGTAHEEGFSSIEEKIKEKLQLFSQSQLLIYCKDQALVRREIEETFSADRLISWSTQAGADFVVSTKKQETQAKIILIKPDLNTFTFQVPFTDTASIENITHVIVAALTLGQEIPSIQEGLNHLKPVDMRLTLKPGLNDSLIIDDTYNNDIAGLKVALEFLSQQRPKRRKILILSDLLQQGIPEKIYSEVSELIKSYGLDQIIGVGGDVSGLRDFFPNQFSNYPTTEALLQSIDTDAFQNDLILITGARPFAFERIVNRLQQRIHGTTLEINLNALTHNFNFFKRQVRPETKMMVMVKAFAYGGGAAEIANHLQTMGADYLAVAFSDEGVSLRKQGIRLPIMVLNPVEESFDLLREFDLEPVVFSPEFFKKLGQYAQNHQIRLRIHLDLDTGMHRLGFEKQHLGELKALIHSFPELGIASLYTHLVGADEGEHEEFSLDQLRVFKEMKAEIEGVLDYKPLIHALNSAGIIRYPEFQMDMVRLGIGLYGVEVTGKRDAELKSVSTLKTTISQVKTLPPGATVGYSRKGKLPHGGKIATLAIGYADGYDRRFSQGKGYVLINGKKVSVIGNVCMDMTMVDVSDIDAKAGDEAIIYGEQISLKELGDQIGTIPYELLTNISTRVKRVYYLD
ncbi:MAG: bifunctional UDP-N-acetylmuramoyl-tripeptide:D-alanyl-D-alanine ligase/alanine racemase [Algoriphagus sp.]|uniref:bifunctional UDP-N-acetylmuramoyl-tripeptide:D-alanyl-D-alanine ligase/alanine racemase n=1 Tax=Algoriphagus sp. TaxID=1872435 RepID=UPI00272F6B56|nr:bifunctional UDP-N-acetylmuramoyl-tripeptide:D-alanyl-D-alanine ligase/alanine racemase [Algoriphagus sp.]MDP2041382.1 bifunctional UDP-N-acetylmuramoyl-tripeptide:D-alanyl-D-alanine ligase/alanine racemase [Algoriphagus sp.]MDP3473286.1 bifunctional UDP-N-acetylmuramoyl-tripeptide:D-alanyl-D-alanine ligase/alanine racemase [Algoriphagus sp.]